MILQNFGILTEASAEAINIVYEIQTGPLQAGPVFLLLLINTSIDVCQNTQKKIMNSDVIVNCVQKVL